MAASDNNDTDASSSMLQRALARAPLALFVLDPTGMVLLVEGEERGRLGLASPRTIGQSALHIYGARPQMVWVCFICVKSA